MKPHRKLPRAVRAAMVAQKRRSLLQRIADRRFRVLATSPERYGGRSLENWIHFTGAADRARRVTEQRFMHIVDNYEPSIETPT